MKRIAVLGSTGSIGTQTLDVVARHPDRFRVEVLAAGANVDRLAQQIAAFRPRTAAVATREAAERLRLLFPGLRILWGEEGLIEAAAGTEADTVVAAVVGSAGLRPVLAAVEAGKQVCLANKEALVAAGHLVTAAAVRKGVAIVPVDSEHSAIFQCLNGRDTSRVARLVLTASGGSFRDRSREELVGVTVEEALQHPNWSMGAKITVDSATMANKGLEVIEAHWLFGVPYERIAVLLHPESVVHSLVEFVDGSVLAQLGVPDMRVPIQYALTYPDRLDSPAPRLDLTQIGSLHFRTVDFRRFPALAMAFESGKIGGTMPAVYNAANEIAVRRFLSGELSFLDIEACVESVLSRHRPIPDPDLETVLEADAWAREEASRFRAG